MKRITTKNGYYIKCRTRKEQINAIRTYNRYRHLKDLFEFLGGMLIFLLLMVTLYFTFIIIF